MSLALPRPKMAATEQFPVASLVLAPAVRGAVLDFYRFVRRADDVADHPGMTSSAKLGRLQAMLADLDDPTTSEPLAAALHGVEAQYGTGLAEARQLLAAFVQDARQDRHADWDGLLGYCRLSAVPVGRFLLGVHGEAAAAQAPADALCIALQLLNHLQDLADDRRQLGRIYLPTPWLDRAGGIARFFDPAPNPRRREVVDAALDQVDGLLDIAACLPAHIFDRRLAWQARLTLAAAHALSARLRRHDPIERAVRLGRLDLLAGIVPRAVAPPATDPAITRRVVQRSGTSFRFGIRTLKGDRRRALHAVYAFCRIADDIADGGAPAVERLGFLDGWRRELDRLDRTPCTPVGRELAFAVERFELPVAELRLLLDGLAIDAVDRLRIADEAELAFYWRAVAGSVGLLSVRIFGTDRADGFALALARALQLVNILRDVAEDAARDRVYLPATRLGLADTDAGTIIRSRAFATAWQALAVEAEDAFAEAERLLAGHDRRLLTPAVLMMWSYRPLLARMRRTGWNPSAPRPCLHAVEKLRLAWLAVQEAP